MRRHQRNPSGDRSPRRLKGSPYSRHGFRPFFSLHAAGHLFSERLAEAAVSREGIVGPLAASFLGLIPSCATSVVLAEGFGSGLVSFPALVSGLTANAGVGLLVLIKECRNRSRTLGVVILLIVSALISGSLAGIAAPF